MVCLVPHTEILVALASIIHSCSEWCFILYTTMHMNTPRLTQ